MANYAYLNKIANTDGSEDGEIELFETGTDPNENEDNPHPLKSPCIQPHVYLIKNLVLIAPTVPLYKINVIIKSQTGSVVYNEHILIINNTHTITLPITQVNDILNIELIYQGHHLIGYF